jgi:hypothetical protein
MARLVTVAMILTVVSVSCMKRTDISIEHTPGNSGPTEAAAGDSAYDDQQAGRVLRRVLEAEQEFEALLALHKEREPWMQDVPWLDYGTRESLIADHQRYLSELLDRVRIEKSELEARREALWDLNYDPIEVFQDPEELGRP